MGLLARGEWGKVGRDSGVWAEGVEWCEVDTLGEKGGRVIRRSGNSVTSRESWRSAKSYVDSLAGVRENTKMGETKGKRLAETDKTGRGDGEAPLLSDEDEEERSSVRQRHATEGSSSSKRREDDVEERAMMPRKSPRRGDEGRGGRRDGGGNRRKGRRGWLVKNVEFLKEKVGVRREGEMRRTRERRVRACLRREMR